MQRYVVNIVSPGATGQRPTLLVPFPPTAIVTAFIDELWKRIARQNLSLAPNTHVATLHLNSETGAILDIEDVLSDVVTNPDNEQLFAVIREVTDASMQEPDVQPNASSNTLTGPAEGEIAIRVVTAATAKNRDACPVVQIAASSTLKHLHDCIAEKLHITSSSEDDADSSECNCTLANAIADGPCPADSFLVVHDKSHVERLQLTNPTELTLKTALRERFGNDVETKKKISLIGADVHASSTSIYRKPPVVSMCAKSRHTPQHARVDITEDERQTTKVLDLHTSELPIHPASANATIEEAGLSALAVDGVVDIFAVHRTRPQTGSGPANAGKSSIFRSRAHWVPPVPQSDRGIAMFLSSLRVFVSLIHDTDDERYKDAVTHVLDLLSNFPPAVRALHILAQGKTPTSAESAALSHAIYEILDGFAPTEIIGTDHSRVFECARLLFGFLLEKGRSVKLADEEGAKLPYLESAFSTLELRDHKTNEGVMRLVHTSFGVTEACLFDAFAEGGVLVDSHLQSHMVKADIVNATATRLALLSGGASEVIAFSTTDLSSNYRYNDAGNVDVLGTDELSELNHLAELCGRHKLAVHKPTQLSSAVTPCLSFDRNAHLSVYTGEQPCGVPGHSSLLFRPKHGEETIDVAVVEQLIAPILQGYEADGTAVFDALGGAAVRRLQSPDEILIFCVDCSASMRKPTDFDEVNDDPPVVSDDSSAESFVNSEFYNRATFDDMKESLCNYEGFHDIIAIVAEKAAYVRRAAATQVLSLLRTILSTELIGRSKALERSRQYANRWHYARSGVTDEESSLNKLKAFWAGLKTHEQSVTDFLVYRATASTEISQRWTWSLGDAVPSSAPALHISSLPEDITELPHNLRCPISHNLMEDAVTAADGHIYSHRAISEWFRIRRSSPMTGLDLTSAVLNADQSICDAAKRWVDGDDIPGRVTGSPTRFLPSSGYEITFDSKVGSFQKRISPTMTLKDLYKLAFRVLKGKFVTFQLSTERYGPLTPTPEATVSSRQIRSGTHITIRIADDDPVSNNSTTRSATASNDMVLVKVYQDSAHNMAFGYWVKKDTTQTLAAVLWKYWRFKFRSETFVQPREMQVWTDMNDSGDGLLSGSPRESIEKLSLYLNASHCFGKLGAERVYREDVWNNVPDGPLVLKVDICAPWKEQRNDHKMSRLDVLKQMFEALINRMLAYNFKSHVGLVTFRSVAEVSNGISHVLENFRRSTNDMNAEGDTSLWDALALAQDQLVEYGKKYPEANKRIICISDGLDTKSKYNNPADVCWSLKAAGIAVDSVSLGDEQNLDLRTISYLLGSYAFQPTSLVNALAICEMEPFLSTKERPTIKPPPGAPNHAGQFKSYFRSSRYRATPTIVTSERMPDRIEHENLHDGVILLASAARAFGSSSNSATNAGAGARANLRISRLQKEMRAIVASGVHPKYDIYVSEKDMSYWKIVMDGPDESPYAGGSFMLYLHADEGYPTFPPKARFITKIKHPNVNMHGRICHSIFDRDWTSDITMSTLLETVYGLLYQPEHSDPVNTTSTLEFHHDEVEFADDVRQFVRRHAMKNREAWERELIEEEDEMKEQDEEMGDD